MSKRKTIINLICSVLVLIVNTIINFWLSPFIVENIGVEANGFISLANNVIMYANLIVTALNGMANRFITIAYTEKKIKKANLFYNSVFWGNLFLVAILFVPAICLIVFFENVFDVPHNILISVKILFAFTILGFFFQTGAPNWNTGCYVTNNLSREYIPETICTIIRAGLIFLLFSLLTPQVWFVGLTSFISISLLLCVNCYNTHKLTPELRIKFDNGKPIYSWSVIKELVGSGLWNSISNMGNILLSGFDLLMCNMLLGATAMGVMAVSKVLANLLQQLAQSLTRSFAPELTIDYAQGNKDQLFKNISRSMKLTACIMTIFVGGFVAFGKPFFSLWIPSQDAKLLSILSSISFLGYFFTSGTQVLYNVFSTVNKVKQNAIAMMISGLVSIILTFILVYFTELDLYAVAGVSTVCNFIRNMIFTLPMAAKYLGFKKTKFFPSILKSFISTSLICFLGFMLLKFIDVDSWFKLIISACVVGMFGIILNGMIILSKEEKKYIYEKIRIFFLK